MQTRYPHTLINLAQTVLKLQLESIWIASLDHPNGKLNLSYWRGWVIEIYCTREQQEWVPYAIRYCTKTPAYIQFLKQNLSRGQWERFAEIIQAAESN